MMKKVTKYWGHEIPWADTKNYRAKILHLNRGKNTARQLHELKDKTIYVLQGLLILELGIDETKNDRAKETKVLETNESYRIKPKTVHRFVAPTEGFVRLMVVSTPEENDSVILQNL